MSFYSVLCLIILYTFVLPLNFLWGTNKTRMYRKSAALHRGENTCLTNSTLMLESEWMLQKTKNNYNLTTINLWKINNVTYGLCPPRQSEVQQHCLDILLAFLCMATWSLSRRSSSWKQTVKHHLVYNILSTMSVTISSLFMSQYIAALMACHWQLVNIVSGPVCRQHFDLKPHGVKNDLFTYWSKCLWMKRSGTVSLI